MCPNQRSQLPPFGEPFSSNDELVAKMSVFANKLEEGYHMEELGKSLGRNDKEETVTTSDQSGMNCQKGIARNLRNKRPCKAILGAAEARESNLNLGDSGPGRR